MRSRRGRSEGAELEGENKRGGGVMGYFTTLEGLVGLGEQCDNVTLPHSSPSHIYTQGRINHRCINS